MLKKQNKKNKQIYNQKKNLIKCINMTTENKSN